MAKIVVWPINERYKLLVYSNNTFLINEFITYFTPKNIEVLPRSFVGEKIFTKTLTNSSYYKNINTIIDISHENIDPKYITELPKPFLEKTIFILENKKNNTKTLKDKYFNDRIYFLDTVSKTDILKMLRHLNSHLTDKKPFRVKISAGKHIKKVKKNTRLMFGAIVLMLFFLPYLFLVYVFLSSKLLNMCISSNAKIKSVVSISNSDLFIKSKMKSYIKFLNQGFIGNVLYGNVSVNLDREYEVSKKISQNLHGVYDLHGKSGDMVFGLYEIANSIKYDSKNNIKQNGSSNTIIVDNLSNKGVADMITAMLGFLNHLKKEETKIGLIVYGPETITPTGGGVKKIYIIKTTDNEWERVDTFDEETLNTMFVGKISGIDTLPEIDGVTIFDRAYDMRDKYFIINTILREKYKYEISGIVAIDEHNLKSLERYLNTARQDNPPLKDLVELYNILIQGIKNRSINVYLERHNNVVYTNSFFNNGDISVNGSDCYDNNIGIGSYFVKNNEDVTNVRMVVKEANNTISVKFFFMKEKPGGYTTIYSNSNLIINDISNTGEAKIIKKNSGNSYSILKTEDIGKKEQFIEFLFPVSKCNNGYGINLEKASVLDKIWVDYEINLTKRKYLYINKNLTGQGNKFYNSKSVLMEDVFSFLFREN